MHTKPIEFDLPDGLVAQEPARPRDSARLLVYDRASQIVVDDVFYNLDKHLPKETTIVLNNTKVDKCRWLFDAGKMEVFVLQKLDTHTIQAMVRPGKRFKDGAHVQLAEGLSAEVVAINADGLRTLRLSRPHNSSEWAEHEHIPLPPYIAQDDSLADEYQTVYANSVGSKAAPTAGLHFTEAQLRELHQTHDIAELELQVSLGTFAPLTQANFDSGKLHKENYWVDTLNLQKITEASHITAVGTTSLRTLESLDTFQALGLENKKDGVAGATDIFITPGYEFRHVDSLVTNFHLPGTSLLLLVEAFVGSRAETERIYQHAIDNNYRFYSFGDAMLIV